MSIKRFISIGFLVFIPLSVTAEHFEWGALVVFFFAALGIIPLAIWLSTATEEVALATGPTIGGLLNAVFGNATELIIALVALRAGLVDIVKASITGTLIANLLLVLGLSMFLGGIRFKEQSFAPVVARVNSSSMTVAIAAILLPAMVIYTSVQVPPSAISQMSIIAALIMIVVYVLTLLFSLKTHSYLYDVSQVELSEEIEAHHNEPPNLKVWIPVLVVATLGVAFQSEIFVGAVEEATEGLGLTPLFTGVILLPLVGGAAEYVTAVGVALKNNMDLSVSIAMGSSLLVALLVAPVLVLIGQVIGQPMDLNFSAFEVVAVIISVVIANLISLDGRSNWLEGALLLATFGILGTAFYFHPV